MVLFLEQSCIMYLHVNEQLN